MSGVMSIRAAQADRAVAAAERLLLLFESASVGGWGAQSMSMCGARAGGAAQEMCDAALEPRSWAFLSPASLPSAFPALRWLPSRLPEPSEAAGRRLQERRHSGRPAD